MTHPLSLIELDPQTPTQIASLTDLWNAALPSNLMISTRLIEFNLQPITGGVQTGRLAMIAEKPVGFVIASTLPGQPQVAPPTSGWIDALVVDPAYQRQGIGTALLAWAEDWLVAQGSRTITLGASQRPFVPGVPSMLDSVAFFHRHGYGHDHQTWDMAANLADYQPPETVRKIEGTVRLAQQGDEAALGAFLQREFPGRWHFEFTEFLRRPAYRLSDYMLLWSERGVDGFCQLTFEDSLRPIERYFPYQLPRHWGQLGPIGVSADRRGRGYGAALLDTGLRRLYNNGINGCVIDWTTHLALYGKFGFTPYHEYTQLKKQR